MSHFPCYNYTVTLDKLQESSNQFATDGRPAHKPKRRLRAINKGQDQDTNGATSMTDVMAPGNQNANKVIVYTKYNIYLSHISLCVYSFIVIVQCAEC